MRELRASEFARIETGLERALAVFVYRENELARMEAAFTGGKELNLMTAQLKSLRGKIDASLSKINALASSLSDDFDKATARVDGAAVKASAAAKEINDTAASIEAAIGGVTNGPE